MSAASQSSDPGAAVLDWARRAGWPAVAIERLEGDVSARRYYRLHRADGRSAVLATYPESLLTACDRFVASRRLLAAAQVRVPEILAADCSCGRMLLEDLGSETLFERRRRGWRYLAPLVEHAAETASRIAGLARAAAAELNPPLDLALMSRELTGTWTVALEAADLASAGLAPALDDAFATMLETLAASPRRPCHRDFMARNLMPVDASGPAHGVSTGEELCVLDFQDLRLGPRAYDIASLLNDSLYAPRQLEEAVLRRHLPRDDQRLDYHRSAAQRTLKIVGTFIAFARRGFGRHLGLLEPTLRRARFHLRRLPELGPARTEIDALANALLASSAAARRPEDLVD